MPPGGRTSIGTLSSSETESPYDRSAALEIDKESQETVLNNNKALQMNVLDAGVLSVASSWQHWRALLQGAPDRSAL